MTAFEVISLILSLGGGLLGGHAVGKRRAAKLSEVLQLARDAGHAAAIALRYVTEPTAADVVSRWTSAFGKLLAAAGLDVTASQHDRAWTEGQAEAIRVADLLARDQLKRAIAVAAPKLKESIAKLERARLDEPFERKNGKASR